jgi:hypothetical protein
MTVPTATNTCTSSLSRIPAAADASRAILEEFAEVGILGCQAFLHF